MHYVIMALLTACGFFVWQNAVVSGKLDAERVSCKLSAEQVQSVHAETVRLLNEEMIRKERDSTERLAALATTHQQERDHAKAETDRTIAAVRAGTLRVQNRFVCPTTDTATGDGTSSASGGSDGSLPRGLQDTDVEFLVRFADDAHTVGNRLTLCQKTVVEYRRQCGISR